MSTPTHFPVDSGGVVEFADGGQYCGEWSSENGADGYGVCTGPGANGVFAGKWDKGEQSSGVFTWNSGHEYAGTWGQGMRHGVGEEIHIDGSKYSGEFSCNFRGVYGILRHPNGALYSGMWSEGLQNGEGMEVYIDEGIYKGEYRSGVRHGYGSRTSSAYEAYEKSYKSKQTLSSPLAKRRSVSPQPGSFVTPLRNLHRTSTPALAALPTGRGERFDTTSLKLDHATIVASPSAQIYEGQWKEDMRHGYGVLKVPDHYSYFGEWKNNGRTGYGVMVYDDGHREEGQWDAGKLIFPLKRKKLSIKYYQLEAKVKQAHTQAIQSADLARTRAIVAESKASAASVRSVAAQKAATAAEEHSQKAKLKALQLENSVMPYESTNQNSPVGGMIEEKFFPGPAKQMHHSFAQPMGGLLQVPQKGVKMSPSYEDLVEVNRLSDFSDSSNSSVDGEAAEGEENDGLTEKRREHKESLQVRALKDYPLESIKHAALRATTSDPNVTASSSTSVTIRVRRPSNDLRGTHSLSLDGQSMVHTGQLQESGGTNGNGAVLPPDEKNQKRLRKRKQPILLDMHKDGVYDESPKELDKQLCLVDQSTGELVVGDGDMTEEELLEVKKKGVIFRSASPNPNMEMLKQMANWNRAFVYLNFFLLIFLLLLISAVIFFVSYTMQLGTNQNPSGFIMNVAA